MNAAEEGIVYKSTGSWYKVRMGDSSFLNCRVRGKLKLLDHKMTNPVAVGDKVVVKIDENHSGTGIINNVLPRTNFVIRKSVHKTEHGHLLAANITQAILMVTIKYPRTSHGFIDRFLVSTEAFRIPSVLIINKLDLYNKEDNVTMDEMIATYDDIGVKCYPISLKEKKGVKILDGLIKGKTSLLAGHSGTGKSTLMNFLDQEINQEVGKVSDFANKGIHTTTFAEMFEIAAETYVIDTPGIKELGLIDIGDHELSDYFPEMRALLGKCKYHNCNHTHEPNCMVIDAVENGDIALSRYNSYISMIENIDTRR